MGRITEDGYLQCPYHGWCFDGATGRCTAIPNLHEHETIPGRIKVAAFTTAENVADILGFGLRTPMLAPSVGLPTGMSIRMLHPCSPETRQRTRTPVTFNPQHITRMGRTIFPFTAHIVGRQDNWALRKQNDTCLLPRPNSDLSSRFDKAGLRYRRVYQALVARQEAGDFSYQDDPAADVSEVLGINTRA